MSLRVDDDLDLADPGEMTAEQRLGEVARILAVGVLRLHERSALGGASIEIVGQSGHRDLEVTASSGLDRRAG